MTQEIIQSQQNEISQEDILIQVLQTQKELKQNQEVLAGDVDYLKNKQPINPSVSMELEKLRKTKVINALGGMESLAYKNRSFAGKVFRQAAKDFKEHFRIPRYDMLQVKDEQAAFDYWDMWEPSTNIKMEIQQENGQGRLASVG
ncbi:ORF6C domain-containing protein [Streptococcus minor]|uniref:ORF6C domain-containing protein n=1 Tax=Streptococcus minor TaxID=229549 RepID=UPI00037C89B0|nr:ORF6C domain-containing protein [Streptococcus minor]